MSWQTLVSDGFEGLFQDWAAIGELTVPAGWMPTWTQGTEPGVNHRPECDRETERARSGSAAAKMFSTHASHTGALVKRMQIKAGTPIRATAYGATFRIKAGHALRVGIDPEGGLDHESESIVWSRWWGQDNPDWEAETYHEFSVAVQSPSDYVSVFLYSHSRFAGSTVAAYWDDVLIEQDTEGSGSEPSGDLIGVLGEIRDILAEIRDRL
jgi:hypothetical protein